ncbi:MAG: DOMON-like domain-containing protein [Thermodesulfobacteriota bacterium]
MSRRPFALLPFPGESRLPLRIGGSVTRQGRRLTLVYELTGAVAGVEWPAAVTAPARQDNLWQQTCSECFLARPEKAGYWETNLSPAGHWQLYRFDDYRTGMRPEAAVAPPEIAASRRDNALSLAATLDLGGVLAPHEPLLLGVTMVVRSIDGATSHWALAHPGERPDFHQRAAWTIAL